MLVASDPSAGTATADKRLDIGVLSNRLLDAVVVARVSSRRIVQWNPAAERLFGYSAQEAIGKPIEILMPEPIAHLHRVGFERYLRTGHGLIIDAGGPVEMPARTKTGEEIRVELSLSEVTEGGERYAVAIARDAGMRKQLELTNLELVQARVARSEAEAALANRDDLIDTLATTLQSHPTADELDQVVAALADIRRLQRGEVKIRTVDGDLVDLVHAACDAARRRMAGRRLLVHTPPSAPASFDPARLRQVLDQVLDDLIQIEIQRTPEGARIEVRVEALSPQVVRLSVRADEVAASGARRAGIALYLSRLLLQQQGGTLMTVLASSGSLEVVMTLPGSPHPMRRRPGRSRMSGRRASATS